jgi:hypothetical protein
VWQKIGHFCQSCLASIVSNAGVAMTCETCGQDKERLDDLEATVVRSERRLRELRVFLLHRLQLATCHHTPDLRPDAVSLMRSILAILEQRTLV